MSQIPPTTHAEEDRYAATRALFERRLALLAWLIEIGMACVRAVGRRAVAKTPAAKAPRAAGAFERMSRAVRLAMALMQHTHRMFQAWKLAPEAWPPADDVNTGAEGRGETESLDDHETFVEYENLTDYESFREHRTERDQFDSILKKPFEDIIARICKDLGVRFDRDAWTRGARPEAVFDTDPQTIEAAVVDSPGMPLRVRAVTPDPSADPHRANADLSADLSAEARSAKAGAHRAKADYSVRPSGGP